MKALGSRLAGSAILQFSRGVFLARRAFAENAHATTREPAEMPAARRRNILFVTTDQQRFDSLGIAGNRVTRTPTIDALARSGIFYERAHVQNVVCMPSRTTMLTGQHPLTHGVVANGICAPDDGPNVASLLHDAGYHTALIGKAHFDPHLDPFLRFPENRLAASRSSGPWRGFAHVELATHGPVGGHHYADWLWSTHPEDVRGFGFGDRSDAVRGLGRRLRALVVVPHRAPCFDLMTRLSITDRDDRERHRAPSQSVHRHLC